MRVSFRANSFFVIALIAVNALVSMPSFAMTKCQDAQGKWHYGDYATQECKNSELTELNDRGFIIDKTDAPKTQEQLQQQRDQEKIQKQKEAHQLSEKKEQERILNIYETEEDINRIRDNQLNSVQSNIEVHKAYLKSVKSRVEKYEVQKAEATTPVRKKKIDAIIVDAKKNTVLYSRELSLLEEQKIEIEEKFKKEKALYKMLKEQPETQGIH